MSLPHEISSLINSSIFSHSDASQSLLLTPNDFWWFLQDWIGLDSRYLVQNWLFFNCAFGWERSSFPSRIGNTVRLDLVYKWADGNLTLWMHWKNINPVAWYLGTISVFCSNPGLYSFREKQSKSRVSALSIYARTWASYSEYQFTNLKDENQMVVTETINYIHMPGTHIIDIH